jgi:hypothetical protein
VDAKTEGLGSRAVELPAVDERAERMEQRLQWPLLVAALLTIPAIAIEHGNAGYPWDTVGAILNWTTGQLGWRSSRRPCSCSRLCRIAAGG